MMEKRELNPIVRRRQRWPGLASVLALLAAMLPSLASSADELAAQRQAYREARTAIARGQIDRARVLMAGLAEYPLLPYLEAALAGRKLHDDVAVQTVLSRHDGLIPAETLRRDWLERLAEQGRWRVFLDHYRPQQSVTLRCHALTARLKTGGSAPLDDTSIDLWQSGHSRPDACDPVFRHWNDSGALTPAHRLDRAERAVAAGEFRMARWLSRSLGPRDREHLERAIALRRDPRRELGRARHWPDDADHRRLVGEALLRLAGKDSEAADHLWVPLSSHFSWSEDRRLAILRRITLMRATDYPDDALDRLAALPAGARDRQIREWTVRVALHRGDWPAVLSALEAMPADEAGEDRWRYWRARSLETLGRGDEARAIYVDLAQGAHYHGFLAAQRLGLPYSLCPQLRSVDPQVLAEVTGQPGFARAIELFHVGQRHDARREFAQLGRTLSAEQRRVAAVLADEEGWHDQAIRTLADAGFLRLYSQRFPLAYADRVGREAARRRLNPSLVYGVMRSESAMAPDAVSSANARGLMQLTRATGRKVARDYRLPTPSIRDLLDPDRNIALGSAYLDQLFAEFGHPLLVLAAYNAGPEPVQRWQDDGMPVEADRWIETLPYYETRDYLPRVLAFATLYDWRRFGRMVPLAVRMPDLDTRPGKSDLNARPSVQPQCPLPVTTARADQGDEE